MALVRPRHLESGSYSWPSNQLGSYTIY
jgi:hypothetical protein